MGNGLGGLLGGLLGIAILATVASNIIGKGNSIWDGTKETAKKIPKGDVKFW
jgi:hypothetical protein